MAKRPSLFTNPPPAADPDVFGVDKAMPDRLAEPQQAAVAAYKRPQSRTGKRVLSVYLDPLAWKQLRQLALDSGSTTQALGEEAVTLLFTKHGMNRSA
jgi:hypothetical protein